MKNKANTNCSNCGICDARKLLSKEIVAVLIGNSGIIKTYTSKEEAELDLNKYQVDNSDVFLIRGYTPEWKKSYNLVNNIEDIPL